MVFDTIKFVQGAAYTFEEVQHLLENDGDEEHPCWNPKEKYNGTLVHPYPCCSPLQGKMFVVGSVVHISKRKYAVSCANCTMYDSTRCEKCAKRWKGRVGNSPARACPDCWKKGIGMLEVSAVCDTCLGTCTDGVYPVRKYFKKVVDLKPFTSESDSGDLRTVLCRYCSTPSIGVHKNDECKHCGFYDIPFRGFDQSSNRYHAKLLKLPRKKLSTIPVLDGCISCS